MANIKEGDRVVTFIHGSGDYVFVKTVRAINPKTLRLVDPRQFEGREVDVWVEPRQNPKDYRIYDREKVERMQALCKEIDERQKEVYALFKSLPEIKMGEGGNEIHSLL